MHLFSLFRPNQNAKDRDREKAATQIGGRQIAVSEVVGQADAYWGGPDNEASDTYITIP